MIGGSSEPTFTTFLTESRLTRGPAGGAKERECRFADQASYAAGGIDCHCAGDRDGCGIVRGMDTGPERFCMGHDDGEIGDIYSKLKEDAEEAEIGPGGSVWASSFRLKGPLLDRMHRNRSCFGDSCKCLIHVGATAEIRASDPLLCERVMGYTAWACSSVGEALLSLRKFGVSDVRSYLRDCINVV